MLSPLPLGEVEPQARERVKRMLVSHGKLKQRTPLPAAAASDLPRCAGEVTAILPLHFPGCGWRRSRASMYFS